MADGAKPVACGYESGSGGRVSVPVLPYPVATLSCSSIFSERLVLEKRKDLSLIDMLGICRGGAKAAWSTRTDDKETWDCDASFSCTLQPGKEITIESDWRLLDCPGTGFEGCVYAN